MRLPELLRSAGVRTTGSIPDLDVGSVVQDHRLVRPGSLFIARSGASFDGRNYLEAARLAGAVAAVAEPSPLLAGSELPAIAVDSAARAVAPLAAAFHGWPARKLSVTGVTGTDGKTTTSFLLHHLLSGSRRTGLLTTVATMSGDSPLEGTYFTTPESTELQASLADMVADGCSHVVLESSSHGLSAGRLDAIDFDLAVWTNLTREHLDFHINMEGYRAAKAILISRAGHAILNSDDDWHDSFAAAAPGFTNYGLAPGAKWLASDVSQSRTGLSFAVHSPEGHQKAFLPMTGTFNVLNALAAMAAAATLGVPATDAIARLASFGGVPGRMQVIQSAPFTVIVDFAHTAAALANALQAARSRGHGRILLVTGAAGERDHGKRGAMATVAAGGADALYLTEEDSTVETTASITGELARYARDAGAMHVEIIEDRRAAITAALGAARPGDVVLLAGKGAERKLDRPSGAIPWNEAEIARELLAAAGYNQEQ